MHRHRLVELLLEYGTRHPEEQPVVDRFQEFVTHHERCFERDCWAGHITGSAWLVSRDGERVLLTHHRKLGRWLQVGGHSDGDGDPLRVAVREAEEESGLTVAPVSEGVFDLDVHRIPPRRADPAHLHFDVRFALRAVSGEMFRVSDESHDLAWVPVGEIRRYTTEESVLRMARKWWS